MTAVRGHKTPQRPMMYNQGLFEVSSTQKHSLGTIRELSDGRRFVYCSNTAAAIGSNAGGVLISKANAPVDATVAAADITASPVNSVDITCTIASATANLYKDGYLAIKAGPGIGQLYGVLGNTATGNPATGRASFQLDHPISPVWTTSTTIAAWQNPYGSLLLNPAQANAGATTSETVMGVAVQEIAASSYFWAQTWGICNLVLDVDAAAGNEADEMVVIPGTTAGRGAILAAGATGGRQIIGQIIEAADLTDAEGNLIFLRIS